MCLHHSTHAFGVSFVFFFLSFFLLLFIINFLIKYVCQCVYFFFVFFHFTLIFLCKRQTTCYVANNYLVHSIFQTISKFIVGDLDLFYLSGE